MITAFFTKAHCDTSVQPSNEKHLVKPSELDIYHDPEVHLKLIPQPPSPLFLYENVSAARKKVTGAFSGLLTTHEKIYGVFESLENRLKAVYQDTVNDPYYLLTPGAISLAVIGGAAVAGRGRRPIKRSLYALTFGLTATAVSYPQRSLEILETGYYHTSGAIHNLTEQWRSKSENITEIVSKQVVDKLKEKPSADNEGEQKVLVDDDNVIPETSNHVPQSVDENPEPFVLISNDSTTVQDQETLKTEKHEIIKVDSSDNTANEIDVMKVEGDHGQSNADDADMYSTRS